MENSANQLGISSEGMGGLDTLETHFQRSIWEETIRNATHEDFKDIQHIFQVTQRFLDVASKVDFEPVPILGWRIRESKKQLHGLRLLESPRLVRLAATLLLNAPWREKCTL